MKYVCDVCGWVYDEEETGVKFEDLPEDFECPCAAWEKISSPPRNKYSLQGTVQTVPCFLYEFLGSI